jgi:hypothetical protein
MMLKILLCGAYGYLSVSALLHFYIDVVQQHIRGQRPPGTEATLYNGLHSAYSLGQVLFASIALVLIWRGSDFMSQRLGQGLDLAAVAGWLAICFLFIEYTPPRIHMFLVLGLLIAVAFASRSGLAR